MVRVPATRTARALGVGCALALTGTLASGAASAQAATGPRLVSYPGYGVSVSGPQDAWRLRATSPRFTRFIESQVVSATKEQARLNHCAARTTITVSKYRADGWATGQVDPMCIKGGGSGYLAVWKYERGWKQVIGTNAYVTCADVNRLRIPGTITPTCFDERTGTARTNRIR